MSASPKPTLVQESLRGTLRILKEGYGSISVYDVTFYAHSGEATSMPSLRMANSDALVELLDRLHIDFRRPEVRQAIEGLLLRGAGNIPDLVFSRDELQKAGLA